ncbi:MAG: tetratricopeptide repeat protein [Acidobacteria bacterium]|nr:tetratricopeptide repeat protein [Acidobacteriota bacterium]MCA1611372.1 tetratricopeptide repeat protein [Acidobacteriota bacterium]
MRFPRAVRWAGVVLLLLAAGVAVAVVYTKNNREVTTSSDEAYQAWRQGLENERRFYFKEARVDFARALQLDPQFAMAMIGLARNSEKPQQIALTRRASRERNRLSEHERLHVDMQQAMLDMDQKRYVETARKIHEKYPNDIRAAMVLARQQIDTGKMDDAFQIFGELLAVEPNNADAYNQIGYYYGYRGDYDRAIENLKKYQFMAPDQANPYDSLGEIQAYSGRYDEAIANCRKALALKSDFFESFNHMGVAYEGKGEPAAAIENYVRASQESAMYDGGRIESLMRAFRVAVSADDAALARQLMSKMGAMPHDKSFDEQYEIGKAFTAAMIAGAEGRLDEAEKGLLAVRPKWEAVASKQLKGTTRKPYWATWNFSLARIRMKAGKVEEAIPLLEEMANPPNRWADFESRRWVYEGRAMLAEVLARKGDLDRADKLLAENHKWNPSWAPSRTAELAVAQMHREKVQAASR